MKSLLGTKNINWPVTTTGGRRKRNLKQFDALLVRKLLAPSAALPRCRKSQFRNQPRDESDQRTQRRLRVRESERARVRARERERKREREHRH
jgi:hypothetical protein